MSIAVIKKNRAEDIRVELTEYRGHDLIDIRVCATAGATGQRVATRKGLTLNVAFLPDLIAALQRAAARAAGLLGQCDGDGPRA